MSKKGMEEMTDKMLWIVITVAVALLILLALYKIVGIQSSVSNRELEIKRSGTYAAPHIEQPVPLLFHPAEGVYSGGS
ncbi:MAG: hypothetical protein QMD85_00170 [Candidatus Aenigmarchaeota archaeon]|nr:hypothetical protein [Candidatus Aenigmarchaeota archaeon]MDI6721942.1 hypothetical protein [Candidatus Aenigmarchaeota archaeon]